MRKYSNFVSFVSFGEFFQSLKHESVENIMDNSHHRYSPHCCKYSSPRGELSFLTIHISIHCSSHRLSFLYKKDKFIWIVDYQYLVLSLVPPPQVTEQEVHEPHVPTSQSTGQNHVIKKTWVKLNSPSTKFLFSRTHLLDAHSQRLGWDGGPGIQYM